jgi:hypothetical protein
MPTNENDENEVLNPKSFGVLNPKSFAKPLEADAELEAPRFFARVLESILDETPEARAPKVTQNSSLVFQGRDGKFSDLVSLQVQGRLDISVNEFDPELMVLQAGGSFGFPAVRLGLWCQPLVVHSWGERES